MPDNTLVDAATKQQQRDDFRNELCALHKALKSKELLVVVITKGGIVDTILTTEHQANTAVIDFDDYDTIEDEVVKTIASIDSLWPA